MKLRRNLYEFLTRSNLPSHVAILHVWQNSLLTARSRNQRFELDLGLLITSTSTANRGCPLQRLDPPCSSSSYYTFTTGLHGIWSIARTTTFNMVKPITGIYVWMDSLTLSMECSVFLGLLLLRLRPSFIYMRWPIKTRMATLSVCRKHAWHCYCRMRWFVYRYCS